MAQQSGEPLKGNINHSVSRWCYGKFSLDELCQACQRIGIKSVELLKPSDWATVKKYGLTCAMTPSGKGIAQGFNRVENHDELVAELEKVVPMAAEAGMPNLICMSGNRKGMDDDEGLKNCVDWPETDRRAVREAQGESLHGAAQQQGESHGLHVRSHQLGCRTVQARSARRASSCCTTSITCRSWKAIIIRTIRESAEYIGHYHTGGNPGRNEIDETQEIYYPAVMRAIVETGYKGFVGQEFVPTGDDPLASLEKCVRICDV